MAFHITITCDVCKKSAQGMSFDLLTETWADMIFETTQTGWKIDLDEAKAVLCVCPDCLSKTN
jgi:hypothetical protein